MSVVDLLAYLGIGTANMSFNTATKIALSAALESFRQQGLIPVRTGFEYAQMMSPWQDHTTEHAAKLVVSQIVAGEHVDVKPVIPETYERKQRRIRFDELYTKWRADPANFDEHEELAPLLEEFQQPA